MYKLSRIFTILLAFVSLPLLAQMDNRDEVAKVKEEYDRLTREWLDISRSLETYEGLGAFCSHGEYRQHTFRILKSLHHYDSMLLGLLYDPFVETGLNHSQYKHALKALEKFEEDYSLRDFITRLKENCMMYKDISKNKDKLTGGSGVYSYDGKVMVLETDLHKYMKHINKRILTIQDHVHMLN